MFKYNGAEEVLLDYNLERLKNLQSKHAWIVHSEDGMDEISPFAITNIIELKKIFNAIK